jgi:hypothetical protein
MQKLRKLIYKSSLVLLTLIVLLPIIGHFLPLVFTNDNIPDTFEEARFYVLPILILLTLFGTIKRPDNEGANALKIVSTVIVSLFTSVVLFFSAFSGMCRWTTGETLFQNRNDENTNIVLREFGCGATDSGSPTYKVCKVKTIISGLQWIVNVDTTKIDRSEWQRTSNQERTANSALPK